MELSINNSRCDSSFDLTQGNPKSSGNTSCGKAEPDGINDQYATWKNAPDSKCYASFDENGTAASVGAYGHLIQMSQYLEAGRSGIPRWSRE